MRYLHFTFPFYATFIVPFHYISEVYTVTSPLYLLQHAVKDVLHQLLQSSDEDAAASAIVMSRFGLFVLHFYFICVLLFVCLTFFVLSEVEWLGGTFLTAGAPASQTPAAHLIISDSSNALVFYFHLTPDCVFHSSRWCTVTLLAFTFSDLLALASLCEPTRLSFISPRLLRWVRYLRAPSGSFATLPPALTPPWILRALTRRSLHRSLGQRHCEPRCYTCWAAFLCLLPERFK